MAPIVWIHMYSAKQRALSPLFTNSPATEQLGAVIADGVTLMPFALYLANSAVCWVCAAVTSGLIVVGVMSGVP